MPIERVIEEYTSRGYTVNQDHPGNIYWEELFKASPNAKVILTVRDNVEVWNRSLLRFMDQVNPIARVLNYTIVRAGTLCAPGPSRTIFSKRKGKTACFPGL